MLTTMISSLTNLKRGNARACALYLCLAGAHAAQHRSDQHIRSLASGLVGKITSRALVPEESSTSKDDIPDPNKMYEIVVRFYRPGNERGYFEDIFDPVTLAPNSVALVGRPERCAEHRVMSRAHLRFKYTGKGIEFQDMNSTCGTKMIPLSKAATSAAIETRNKQFKRDYRYKCPNQHYVPKLQELVQHFMKRNTTTNKILKVSTGSKRSKRLYPCKITGFTGRQKDGKPVVEFSVEWICEDDRPGENNQPEKEGYRREDFRLQDKLKWHSYDQWRNHKEQFTPAVSYTDPVSKKIGWIAFLVREKPGEAEEKKFLEAYSLLHCQLNTTKAEELALEIVESNPKWYKGHCLLGDIYMEQNNYADAVASYTNASLQEGGGSAEIWEKKVDAVFSWVDNDDSASQNEHLKELVKEVLLQCRTKVEFFISKNPSRAQYGCKLMERAVECATKMKDVIDKNFIGKLYSTLSVMYRRTHNATQAEQAAKEAIKYAPGYYFAHWRLEECYRATGALNDSISVLESMVENIENGTIKAKDHQIQTIHKNLAYYKEKEEEDNVVLMHAPQSIKELSESPPTPANLPLFGVSEDTDTEYIQDLNKKINVELKQIDETEWYKSKGNAEYDFEDAGFARFGVDKKSTRGPCYARAFKLIQKGINKAILKKNYRSLKGWQQLMENYSKLLDKIITLCESLVKNDITKRYSADFFLDVLNETVDKSSSRMKTIWKRNKKIKQQMETLTKIYMQHNEAATQDGNVPHWCLDIAENKTESTPAEL